jgi:large subunit ribosomal protein L24
MAIKRLRKDDTVMVIAGKERGKTGKVLRVMPERDRVLIEHVNIIKRHQKPRGMTSQGGIIEREASIHASNVVPLCGRCNKPTRVGHRRLEDGHVSRLCKRCGELLDNA